MSKAAAKVQGLPRSSTGDHAQKSHSERETSAESAVVTMCRHALRSEKSSLRWLPRGQQAMACGMRQPERMWASIAMASVAYVQESAMGAPMGTPTSAHHSSSQK